MNPSRTVRRSTAVQTPARLQKLKYRQYKRIEDLSPEEIGKRWGQKEYIEAMEYVQGAQFFPANKA